MRFHQRGATFLGMLVIIAILGCAVYAAMRLTPLYLEYMSVARALEQTSKDFSGESTSPQQLRLSLERRWTVDDIKSVSTDDIQIKKVGNGYSMRAWYRAEAPFVGNVSLVVDFDKTVAVAQ